jgi:hypothetical protein
MIPPVPTDIKKRLVEEALRIFFEVAGSVRHYPVSDPSEATPPSI